MTLRQTIQAAPGKTGDLITKLAATSNQAVKTREDLFAQLGDEMTRYLDIEEQHFLPLLRKHEDTKSLAADAFKGNRDMRNSLARLNAMPKETDAFLAELDLLNKSFQQHLRNERKELLPAVLKALSDEEARALADGIDDAVAEAEKAKREEKRAHAEAEKREEAAAQKQNEAAAEKRKAVAKAKRDAKKTEAAAAAIRAERESARRVTQKAADTAASAAEAISDTSRHANADITGRTMRVATDAQEALAHYSDASQKIRADLQAVRASSSAAATALTEIWSAWIGSVSTAARINATASRELMQCRSIGQVADLQKAFATSALRNMIEGNARTLEIAQRSSKKAQDPLDARLGGMS